MRRLSVRRDFQIAFLWLCLCRVSSSLAIVQLKLRIGFNGRKAAIFVQIDRRRAGPQVLQRQGMDAMETRQFRFEVLAERADNPARLYRHKTETGCCLGE